MFGYQVENIRTDSRAMDPWYFPVKGEGASGWVRWSFAGQSKPASLQLNLDHLVMRRQEQGEASSEDGTQRQPRDLPELNLNIAALQWGPRNLGKVSVRGKRVAQGMR